MLVLSPFPEEGAGTRFRVSQYIPHLEANGFTVDVDAFFTPAFFRFVYRRGHLARKALGFARLAARRLAAVAATGRYDLIFIYREAFPIGPPLVERFLRTRGPALVLDFDDAIYLPTASEANRFITSLKYAQKMSTIIGLADHVIVGNQYLRSYAHAYNAAVTMIPTCVDTNRFVPRTDRASAPEPLTIGWIGSPTTAFYLSGIADALREVARQHPFVLRVSGAGATPAFRGVTVREETWSLAREVELFNTCDIGVYPLRDDEWARGKCGFKAIQFMACGVAVVASPVGVNRDIIEDGVNGFLAGTREDWVRKIRLLLEDPALRARFGAAGRRTIEQRYSLRVHAPRMAETLRGVTAARHEGRR